MHDRQWKQTMGFERSDRQLEDVHIYIADTVRRCIHLAHDTKSQLEHLPTLPRFKEILYATLFILVSIIALINYFSRRRTHTAPTRPSTPSIEKAPTPPREKAKAPDRVPGTWIPSSFVRPTPAPYPDWDI